MARLAEWNSGTILNVSNCRTITDILHTDSSPVLALDNGSIPTNRQIEKNSERNTSFMHEPKPLNETISQDI